MTTRTVEYPPIEDPWPTRDDALEAAGLIARRARILYGDQLDSVWMYGSRARGDHGPESDLDILLVITARDVEQRRRLCSKLQEELWAGHLDPGGWGYVSLIPASGEQLRDWDTMFFRNVRADAVQVMEPGRPAAAPADFPSGPSARGRASVKTSTMEAFELLDRAGAHLREAGANVRIEMYRVSVSVAYYAAFYAAKALIAYHREGPKTHKGVQRRFHALAVRSSDFPADIAGYLEVLMEGRSTADYDPAVNDWTEAQAAAAIERAGSFLNEVTAWFDRHHTPSPGGAGES